MSGSPGGRDVVNAYRRADVAFGVDPYGLARVRVLQGEIASRLQGLGGHVYVGDRGDPTQSFTGDAVVQVQRFVGAAPLLAHRSAAGTFHDPHPTIDTAATGDSPFADPAARIFAQRMVRR